MTWRALLSSEEVVFRLAFCQIDFGVALERLTAGNKWLGSLRLRAVEFSFRGVYGWIREFKETVGKES